MIVTLMNKHVPLADIEMKAGHFLEVVKLHNIEYMPLSAWQEKEISESRLFKWWENRMIPASREHIRETLDALAVDSRIELLNSAMGLSLSDQYWIRPQGTSLNWEDVNFFTNSFSNHVGEVMLQEPLTSPIDLKSPNNSSDGWLRKKWCIVDGKRYLYKTGSNPYQQEPFNEVAASLLLSYSAAYYQPYQLTQSNGKFFSVCENFIDEHTEFVPAVYIYQHFPTETKITGREQLEHFKHCCDALQIKGTQTFVDDMLILDYLINNTDRHWGNFGAIRNVETLEYVGFAPLFDNGTSMWHDIVHPNVNLDNSVTFYNHHAKQLKLVKDFSHFDYKKIQENLPNSLRTLYQRNPDLSEQRIREITTNFCLRLNRLESYRNREKVLHYTR